LESMLYLATPTFSSFSELFMVATNAMES
jgi:hypothetical protein